MPRAMPMLKRRGGSSGGAKGLETTAAAETASSIGQMKWAAGALLFLAVALYGAQRVLFANPVRLDANSPEILSRATAEQARPAEVLARGVPRIYTYEVVKSHHHDPDAFTQGLLCAGGGIDGSAPRPGGDRCNHLWESTGLNGRSGVRLVNRKNGEVLQQTNHIDNRHFGEGVVLYKNELLMLTWQTNLGLAFDSASLELQREFTTPMTDGWGLTLAPGDKFIGTDSTAILYTLKMDADGNLEETSRSTIHDAEKEVKWLNEIEWVEHDGVGEIWGMIWQTECMARVSPETGEVLGWIDMSGLRKRARSRASKEGIDTSQMDVLNGVAWDKDTGKVFVTGKKWPKLYEVKIKEIANSDAQVRSVRRKCIPRH